MVRLVCICLVVRLLVCLVSVLWCVVRWMLRVEVVGEMVRFGMGFFGL